MTDSNLPRKSTVIQFAPFPVIEIDEIEVSASGGYTMYTLKLDNRVVYAHHEDKLSNPYKGTGVTPTIITAHRFPINAADMMTWVSDNGWESEQVSGSHWIFRAPIVSEVSSVNYAGQATHPALDDDKSEG